MAEESVPKKNKEISFPNLLFTIKRTFYLLGMVILAFFTWLIIDDHVDGMGNDKVIIPGYIMVTHWFIILTLLLTIVALAIRAYDRNEKIKWAKNNLRVLALLSILSPLLFDASFLNISYKWHPNGDAEAKVNLHSMYLACKAYWVDEGPDKSCSVAIASRTTYGYIPSPEVYIQSEGIKKEFHGLANHHKSPNLYTVDAQGKIDYGRPPILVERPALSLFR